MFHFINCVLLAFAPHVIIYKSTKLAEESGLKACVFAALGYAATQIVKIFVMASVLPSSGDDSHSGALTAARDWSLLEEVAKSLISLVEVAGVQATLQLTPNLAKFGAGTRVLAIALGMSFAESALRYAIPLFVGARGAEFSWNYLEMGLASNAALLLHLAFVAAVWLRTRTDLGRAAMPVVWTIIAANAVLPSVDNYLSLVLHVDSWTVLAFHGALALVLAALAKITMNAYNSQRASSAVAGKKAQ